MIIYSITFILLSQVWRIAGGEPHRFKQIGSASVTVNYMTTDDDMKHLLTAASDGSVTLWSTESLLPIYKMKLAGAASHPTFFLHLDADIKLFSVRNLYEGWMDCNSEPTSLKQLSYGLILAGGGGSAALVLCSTLIWALSGRWSRICCPGSILGLHPFIISHRVCRQLNPDPGQCLCCTGQVCCYDCAPALDPQLAHGLLQSAHRASVHLVV